MKQRIAVLGLGTMGLGMARNLLKAGYAVVVWNRTRSKAEPLQTEGATLASTPAEAASGADVILSMLADDTASREVWLGEQGALQAAKKSTVLVESSTATPAWVGELATAAKAQDCTLLDAPVTGSKQQAEAGQLSFLAGGDASALEEVRPVLEAMGKAVYHLGPTGSGARLKLINNFLCGVQVASLAEALTWIERSGLDRTQALEFLTKAAPGSPLLGGVSGRMVQATYEVNFLLPLMNKDMRYAAADAATFGVDLRTGASSESRFEDAIEAGITDKDMSAVIEPVRKASQSTGAGAGKID